MNRFMTAGLVVISMALATADAQAFGRKRGCDDCCTPACCDSGCGNNCGGCNMVEKTVICHKAVWAERDVECTVYKPVMRCEKYTRNVCEMVAEWKDEVRTCTTMQRVAKEVEKQVTRCRMVRVQSVDPCTGCCVTCCKPETYCETVKCCVYECVPVQKQYTVRVCCHKPVTRAIECTRNVCEMVAEKVVRKERFCTMVPVETKVMVPAPCNNCCQPVSCCKPSCCDDCCCKAKKCREPRCREPRCRRDRCARTSCCH